MQVLQALTSLAGLPSRQADDADMDRDMYFVALEGVSRYALSEAVKSIIRGGLGHTFFPSPVEFRQQCEKVIAPFQRAAERDRLRKQQAAENAEFDRVLASRTPEGRARVAAAYARFCEQSATQEKQEAGLVLDPDLVAQVPDAKDYFKRAKVA